MAMLKKNNQPAIRFSDFGILFTILFHQLHEIFQQLQAARFLTDKLPGDGARVARVQRG